VKKVEMSMQGSDLAFYTTKELINELISRETFLGLVLHCEQDLKNRNWTREMVFNLRLNSNLKTEEACRLLDTVVDYLEK
jgi:hypothetical protein